MKPLPLTLRYTPYPRRAAVAWLLPGGDPTDWLRAIAASDVKHADLRLFVLPKSNRDRAAAAALVTSTSSAVEHIVGGLPYGQVGGRLYLPVEAELSPRVTDDELAELLAGSLQYVWTPLAGLVAFEAEEILTIGDLITAPEVTDTHWDWAQPGVVLAPRLLSIEPLHPPTLETMLRQSQDDIGTQSDDLPELPRSDKESSGNPIKAAAARGFATVARAVQWLAQQAPHGAASSTWVNKLENWAGAAVAKAATASLANRHKELHRLMEMLEKNPDEGLKYALPMGSEAHRGLAPPSDRLAPREIDFRLGSLGGGGPADYWDVPPEVTISLHARYRELASREMRLGRYRRAAYIFAQLLGDFHGAASALKTGHHWREAAVLYRDKLHNKQEAARCLEQGRLWTEAIAIYEELRQFEKAGDLHRQLEQEDEARECYRREAARLMADASDFVGAARVLEFKLADIDAAADQLAGGWPDSNQARQCLQLLFALYGRHGRHEDARRALTQFREPRASDTRPFDVVEILCEAASDYPDREIRTEATDTTRVLTAQRLPAAAERDAQRLVSAIARLAPHDRLLSRDGQRFVRELLRPVREPAQAVVFAGEIEIIHRYGLVGCCRIFAATWIAETLFVLGHTNTSEDLTLWRHCWPEGSPILSLNTTEATWLTSNYDRDTPVIFSADRLNDDHLLLHLVKRYHPDEITNIDTVSLQATDTFPTPMTCGPVPGVSAGTLAAVRAEGGTTWIIESESDASLWLLGYNQGVVGSSRFIPMPEDTHRLESITFPFPLHARADHVYLGIGDQLQIFGRDQTPESIDLAYPIIAITGSLRHTRGRIAVAMERGGLLLWTDGDQDKSSDFAQGMARPVVGFTTGGFLVAVDDSQIQVYATAGRHLQAHAQRDHDHGSAVAVLASPRHPDQFALALENGSLVFYRV